CEQQGFCRVNRSIVKADLDGIVTRVNDQAQPLNESIWAKTSIRDASMQSISKQVVDAICAERISRDQFAEDGLPLWQRTVRVDSCPLLRVPAEIDNVFWLNLRARGV